MEPGFRTATRPARYLIGWMPADEAVAALAGRREDQLDDPEFARRADAARQAAASRRPVFGLDGVVFGAAAEAEGPPGRACAANPRLATLFDRGLRLALIDLARVRAPAGRLYSGELPEIDFHDVRALAGWTLRQAENPFLDVHYNGRRRAWTINVRDPNIRIVNHFRTELDHGVGLGFEIRQFGSSLQAVRFRDRFLLVDGYHRAFALLSRGVNVVPGLIGGTDSAEDLRGLAAGLGLDVVLGPRPPMLPDFLDDEVAADVETPEGPRILVVEAMDIRTAG